MEWTVDQSHTVVEFSAKHLGLMTVRGHFTDFDGTVKTEDQRPVAVSAEIAAPSLSTRDDRRDAHLRSADFLDTDNHPKIAFQSTSIEAKGDNTYRVTGNLTMRGQTHPLELEMELVGPVKDPWGGDRVAVSLDGTLSRKRWGLEWGPVLETGGVIVSDEIRVHIEAEAAGVKAA